ncbi:double-stranded RNA-binding protein 2-like [Miscanthus floridulus]|uniref:double-stranded RNA-binding protein 2-like n=1 Tax=Miscanthus floridulus TaxID=154761 RepID=UPI00345A9BD2
MYKNQLQELAQRSCFNLPSYSCIREGPDHAPRFKVTVNFNGEMFESPVFCSTLRQAEHAAAEVALNELSKRGPSSTLAAKVLDETGIYKNLLQETAHRAGLKLPIYTTIRSGPGHTPVFTCTVELAGKTFTGNPGKTKKQAQKNAAMAAWSELKQLPRVGEPSSSSCPADQDDEEQEQVIVTRTLASLNQANSSKVPHQKEKQQSNNRPSSRRSYPKPNTSFYRPYMQNQAYPSVPPDQAMYHLWHRMQATQPTPRFPVVPAMGNTRFPPPAAMLPMYPPPRGQFSNPANQDALGLLPCFPEAAPALPRYFSPYPVSYVPRSPLPVTVHKIHEKRQAHTETVELPDAVVFSPCTTLDSFRTSECGGPPRKVQEPTTNGKEGCTGSSISPEEEHNTLTVPSSTTQLSSHKLEPNEDKQTLQAGLKQPHEQQLMSSSSRVSPSVAAQNSVQRKHYASSIQHDEPIHRRNPPHTNPPALPDLWSSCSHALPRFGSAPPVNSPSSVFQQRPPWLAAPVTVRTAVPVCSARPNVANSSTRTAPARPAAQNRSAPARAEPESHTHNGDRDQNSTAAASSEFNKLHI